MSRPTRLIEDWSYESKVDGITTKNPLTLVPNLNPTPIEGDIWYDGSNLNFRGASSTTQIGSTSSSLYDIYYIVYKSGNTYYAVNGQTGTTDYTDTDAKTVIKDAILACSTAGGGTVLLKNGTYTTNGTIVMQSKVRLIGEGNGTIIAGSGNTGFSLISSTGTSSGSPITDIEIAHMKLDGTNVTNGGTYTTGVKGIYITYIQRGSFHNLYIYNTYATGLGTDFLVDCQIYSNTCESCGRGITSPSTQQGGSGIGIGTGGFTDEPFVIFGNICKNNGKYGIFVEGQSGIAGDYNGISGNIVYGNYHGLGARGCLRAIFDSNISYSNTQDGMKMDDSSFGSLHNTDIRITNNIFRSNTNYGLEILNTHTNTYVADNEFNSNTAGTISASASTTMTIRNNPGYNPLGASAITVGSSPFTYTAGNSPETVYITGGTVSSIAKNSVTLFTATEKSVNLEPNESVVITYSATPTMNKDVH